jgi:hypothetical protein
MMGKLEPLNPCVQFAPIAARVLNGGAGLIKGCQSGLMPVIHGTQAGSDVSLRIPEHREGGAEEFGV